ncbi:type IX secretion system PorP/SprF family membrane protein [Chitinophaga skermanii]|uniref:Type IX secretion system PorP/SprF family membrane protein n=1 Tax=Chitinophaga skermanii TaxID=331697 RepID=A0A327PZ56_9BACT|nr:PorP/SprF family type IX secretion system membrane protein [Chitinophaga skermanii]RAI97530.1 type IX secretion system PorP/SprF family membrane protein [Chitinophaga skermanii]
MNKVIKNIMIIPGIALASLALSFGTLQAQDVSRSAAPLQPMGTQFFGNQYIGNPAFAGIDTGVHISLARRAQWNSIPGAPVSLNGAADAMFLERVGGGIQVYNDKAGLINRTKVSLTYAYHLPLNDVSRLHFGISAGINNERLDRSQLNGDPNDPNLNAFNRRENYFEGDFGMAYTSHNLTIQGSLPNIMNVFRPSDDRTIDGAFFYAAAGYKIRINEALNYIEPKVGVRGVHGYDNIYDFGANAVFYNNYFNVFGLYHSTKNYTVGVGASYKNIFGVQAMYTSQTSGLKTYTDGAFELALIMHLFR